MRGICCGLALGWMVLACALSAEEVVKLTVRSDGQEKNSLSGALEEVARLRAESGGNKKSILIRMLFCY